MRALGCVAALAECGELSYRLSPRMSASSLGLGPPRGQTWLRGPLWDGTWMLCALWLTPLVAVLAAGAVDPRHGALDTLYFALTALFWLGHRVGSSWLAYCTTAFRPLLSKERGRFVWVPCAIAAACFAVLLPGDQALPFTRAQRVMGLVILDYGLVTYHFASQHFGALSLYRVRAGGASSPSLRRLDRLYALLVGGAAVFVAEIVAGSVFFMDVWIDPWLDPRTVAASADSVASAGTAFVSAATLGIVVLEARSERPSLPRALYALGLAGMVIAAFQVRSPFLFVVLWTSQHWIVATGLTTLAAQGEPIPNRSGLRRALHAVNRHPWALTLVLAALSVCLLPLLEVEATDEGPFYAERIFGSLAGALRTSPFVPALIALGFTTAFLHYWLDRAVYRLSDPRMREAARGLLMPAGDAR